MPATPLNKELYEKAKQIVYARYAKPSAYRSGALVKLYKEMGGKYKDDDKKKSIDDKPLKRWQNKEKWLNLNALVIGETLPCGVKYKGQKEPTVCRPSIKASDSTPKPLATQLSKKQIKKAIETKKKGKTINWQKL